MANMTHGFPALLSLFIPGLGQLVKGQIFKAIGIFLAGVISWFIFPFILPAIIWIWNVYDAYNN